jgi:nucleoside-diphosphate kinase
MTRGAVGFGNWIYAAIFSDGSVYKNAGDHYRIDIKTSETNRTSHKGRKPAAFMVELLNTFTEIMERTFLAVKPDGVQRHLIGEIIRRYETKGFKLVGLKMLQPSRELAESHYAVHRERPFFAGLVDFITSGPVVAMVWEGDGVVASARKIIGATNPLTAEPGTIRGDFGVNIGRNIIHGSDAIETAQTEIALWFQPEELVEWEPNLTAWVYE